MSFEDIKGQKFGKVTAIEYLGKSMWKCQCECGNIMICRKDQLQNGKTKSCGCVKLLPTNDIKGQKFGKLTAVEYLGKSMWRCRCECGNTRDDSYYRLTHGKVTSCGCDRISTKNVKICVVCGKEFYDSPSNKRVCCSRKCSSKHFSKMRKGQKMSEEQKIKLSEVSKGRDMTELQAMGTAAAKESPRTGKFETNMHAKDWVLYSPDGEIYECTNLSNWARENVKLFGYDENDTENIDYYVQCITHGIYTIKKNIKRGKGTVTYKDWCLYGWDDKKNFEKWWRSPITPKNPLKFDVLRAFSTEFGKAMKRIVMRTDEEELQKKTGATLGSVMKWTKGKCPNLKHMISLYKNFGEAALPLMNKNGMLIRKEPIPPRGNSIIAQMCAEAGYQMKDVAKAMNISLPVFQNRYNTSGTQARAAVELLYLFGIETIIKYYDNDTE